MRTVFLLLYRVYADFVAVDVAEDLVSFVRKLAQELCVAFEEVEDPALAAVRIGVKA